MREILARQLAADYCCSLQDVTDQANHYNRHFLHEDRRRFQEGKECFLKICVVNGKVLFCGEPSILLWCRENYGTGSGEWFFEAKNLRKLDDRLRCDGYQIEMVHPFFIPGPSPVRIPEECRIRWYEREEIETFRGDARFDEAFAFDPDAPDVLGAAFLEDDRILGMAGASADSPYLWQIGINVDPACRGKNIGTLLVSILKDEIIKRGKLPYYGTSMSHIASQRLAIGAGFVPAWAELVTSRIR